MTPLPTRESIVLPELYGSGRTVQIEYRLTAMSNHMDMGRSMIVRIDHNPQPIQPDYRRHDSIVPRFLSAWVTIRALLCHVPVKSACRRSASQAADPNAMRRSLGVVRYANSLGLGSQGTARHISWILVFEQLNLAHRGQVLPQENRQGERAVEEEIGMTNPVFLQQL